MVNNDSNDSEAEQMQNSDINEKDNEVKETSHRKVVRRTLRDRRRTRKDPNHKGPERRYRIRRLTKDRREGGEPVDDLVKHIP